MDRLSQDFRHATARLSRDRGFAAIAIVTLALGTGANTVVFSLQTVLRSPRPLPAQLCAVALLACLVPAMRAASVDPISTQCRISCSH